MPTFVGDSISAHAKYGCYRCEGGAHLVDMDVQVVGEGALALCRRCIGEAAEVAGIFSNEAVVRELRQKIQELTTKLEVAGDRERRFNRALQASAPLVVPAT